VILLQITVQDCIGISGLGFHLSLPRIVSDSKHSSTKEMQLNTSKAALKTPD